MTRTIEPLNLITSWEDVTALTCAVSPLVLLSPTGAFVQPLKLGSTNPPCKVTLYVVFMTLHVFFMLSITEVAFCWHVRHHASVT